MLLLENKLPASNLIPADPILSLLLETCHGHDHGGPLHEAGVSPRMRTRPTGHQINRDYFRLKSVAAARGLGAVTSKKSAAPLDSGAVRCIAGGEGHPTW